MNQVVLVGKVVDVPAVKEFGNNNQMAIVLLEVEKGYQNANQEEEYCVFQVILWRNLVQKCLEVCAKGAIVGVKGRLQANNFLTKEGSQFYSCEIIAEKLSLITAK